MTFEPAEYVRKSFTVKAEELTFENVDAIAKWCRGKVGSESTRILGGGVAKLPTVTFAGQGEDRGKDVVARLGNFVVEARGRFRVYKEPNFKGAFDPKPKEIEQVAGTKYDPEVDEVCPPSCEGHEGMKLHSVSLVEKNNALPGLEITASDDGIDVTA